jgi:raffinose/stachyose/melibiose transport system substrate-binding protein
MRLAKVFSLLLVIVMVLSLITGCGDKATPAADTKQPDNAEPTKQEDAAPVESTVSEDGKLKAPDKDMTITLWDIATAEPAVTIQPAAVERFKAAYPNIKVDNTHIQNDTYKEKLVIAMSSGQCPDMYIHWTGGPMNEYIDSGFAVPITDLMENYCDIPFLDAAMAQCTYKGEIYAIPYGGLSGSGIYYNKKIFEKLGLSVPKTIAELEAACETLKANGYIPFSLANQSKWTGSMYFMYLATRYGGVDEFNKAVAGTGSFESDAFKYAGDMIQKWVKAGYFPEGVNSLSPDDGQDRQLMYTEEAAMMLHGTWQSGAMMGDNEEWYLESIGYFAFPKLEGSSADQNIVVGTAVGNAFSINAGDDEDLRRACFVLATQFYNDDVYNQMQVESGGLPSIEGMGDNHPDACMLAAWNDFSSASNVQLWYDQYLPPEVSEVHKSTSQEIFGLTKTPEQANKELQEAMAKYLAK